MCTNKIRFSKLIFQFLVCKRHNSVPFFHDIHSREMKRDEILCNCFCFFLVCDSRDNINIKTQKINVIHNN